MFTYHLYLCRKKLNLVTGLIPVYAKITINNHTCERSAGVSVPPKYWNNKFKRISSDCSNADHLNESISAFESKLKELQKTTMDIRVVDSILKSKSAKQGMTAVLLTSVLNHYIDYKTSTIGKPDGIVAETLKTYNSRKLNIEGFLNFINKPGMLITDFNIGVGDKFRDYLYSLSLSKSYVQKHLRFIQALIEYSVNEFHTEPTNYLNIVLRKPKPGAIVHLTGGELEEIIKKVYLSSLTQKNADLFLLQCYTGMSYGDVIKLDIGMLEIFKGRYFLRYNRKKTNNEALLPVHPFVRSILSRYEGKAPKLSNQQYNRMLKELAAIVGINKHLTSHVGRKTFATAQINSGMSAEAVTKMLGKTSVTETTQLYAQIGHQLIINQQIESNQTSLFH